MRIFHLLTIAILSSWSVLSAAETHVVEGDAARALYRSEKGTAQVLVQRDKVFVLRAPDGSETPKPASITVRVGERFFISNEEESFVHNVYDLSDAAWVLQKQHPSELAGVAFDRPGVHELRCAIHPTMKTEVRVVP